MGVKFIFTEDFRRELHIAKCHFDLTDRGEDFLVDLERQLAIVSSIPFGFQVRYRNVRIINFKTFNYSLHYIVQNEGNIMILHLLSQGQDY